MAEVKSAVNAMAHHIHGNRYDIYISRAFPVAEEGSLHPVGSRQYAKFRITDAAASVIVRMHAEHHVLPVLQMLVHILHLRRKHMGHGHLYRGGQIDDGFASRLRLPHVQHGVADLQRIVHLGLGEAFRTVFKGKIPLRLLRQLFQKLRAVHRQLLYGLFILFKDLLPLFHGSGIIKVHHRVRGALHRLEGLFDNVFPGLGQHLDRHVLRYHILLDQRADKVIFRVGRRRETDLDFLKPNLHQKPKKLQLIFQAHGINQRLITVPQIHAAPYRRFFNTVLFYPVICHLRRHVIGLCIFLFYFPAVHVVPPCVIP